MELSEGGAVATKVGDDGDTLGTAEGHVMSAGGGDWCFSARLESGDASDGSLDAIFVGLVHPGLEERDKLYATSSEHRAWFMYVGDGALYGSGKDFDNGAGDYAVGDTVTVCLMADGSILFGRNGAKHGPGYPPGSVKAGTRVVPAVQLYFKGQRVRLLAGAGVPSWARGGR